MSLTSLNGCLKFCYIFFFTNLTILAISGDSEKSGDFCEYGDLREYGDAGESCDSIKSCFFSCDFGNF